MLLYNNTIFSFNICGRVEEEIGTSHQPVMPNASLSWRHIAWTPCVRCYKITEYAIYEIYSIRYTNTDFLKNVVGANL